MKTVSKGDKILFRGQEGNSLEHGIVGETLAGRQIKVNLPTSRGVRCIHAKEVVTILPPSSEIVSAKHVERGDRIRVWSGFDASISWSCTVEEKFQETPGTFGVWGKLLAQPYFKDDDGRQVKNHHFLRDGNGNLVERVALPDNAPDLEERQLAKRKTISRSIIIKMIVDGIAKGVNSSDRELSPKDLEKVATDIFKYNLNQ